jgi:predicted nucleic acid-binding protein
MLDPPAWLEVRSARRGIAVTPPGDLDAGEEAAIALALELNAHLLLLDDREAVAVARGAGINVTGTLGFLKLADEEGLLTLREAVARLQQTNFHCTQELYAQLLADPDTGRSR